MAFADLHRSGFEDIFEEMGSAQPGDSFESALYRNPGNGTHWITLKLEGVRSNRAAFGARVEVVVKTRKGVARRIERTVGFGSSFDGNPMEQHVGIGSATSVAEVKGPWPASGVADHIRDVVVDHRYHLCEGDGSLPLIAAY